MIREFLKNEDGFLGLLGTLAGGILGSAATAGAGGAVGWGVGLGRALGGAVGNALGERRAQKKQAAYDANSYVRMADAARRAGLNPLEVLRAGDPGRTTGRMQFGTSAVMQNSFDQIESILTGDHAAEQRRQEMRDELLRIDIEQAQRGVKTPVGIQSSSLSRVVLPQGNVSQGTDKAILDASVHGEMPEPSPPDNRQGVTGFTWPSGLTVPVFEEWDQAVQAAVATPLVKFGSFMLRNHTQAQENSVNSDAQQIRANLRKNNPGISDAEVEQKLYFITGGKYGKK